MFIQTEQTPNPHTLKFTPGVKVLDKGIKSFAYGQSTVSSPLATRLFQVDGVRGVFLTGDFITVTKSAESDWSYLKTLVLAGILDHFTSGMPTYIDASSEEVVEFGDIEQRIVDMIETKVRPAVAQDGGDISFEYFKDGVVYVRLQGACSGCPSSTITLKDGIERMLQHYIPEVLHVEAVNS